MAFLDGGLPCTCICVCCMYMYMYMYIVNVFGCTVFSNDVPFTCSASTDTGFYVNAGITALDCLVLLSSIFSTYVCGRSLIRTFYFRRELCFFFKQKYSYSLKWKDSLPLFNMWFVGVIISSALAMLGSLMKIILSYQACVLQCILLFKFTLV